MGCGAFGEILMWASLAAGIGLVVGTELEKHRSRLDE